MNGRDPKTIGRGISSWAVGAIFGASNLALALPVICQLDMSFAGPRAPRVNSGKQQEATGSQGWTSGHSDKGCVFLKGPFNGRVFLFLAQTTWTSFPIQETHHMAARSFCQTPGGKGAARLTHHSSLTFQI